MATSDLYVLGTVTTILTTELNALANGGQAVASVAPTYDNRQGSAGGGYTLCDIEFVMAALAGNTNVGGYVDVFFLKTMDDAGGTNFEDGSNSVLPARSADVRLPVRSGIATAQRVIRQAWLPWGKLTPLLYNAVGQALAATSSTVKVKPVTFQGV